MKLTAKTLLAASIAIGMTAGVAAAENVIVLPDASFAPEGIAVDGAGKLYTGSITQGRIVRIVAETGVVSDFAAAGANGMVSVIGLHASGDLIYACSSDPGASTLTGSAPPALLAFDRETGALAGRFELPEGGAFCNDIAELHDGTILATDSFMPRIYALKPGASALEVWLDDPQFAGEGFNLNGIAYDNGAVYVVRYNTGTFHRVAVNDDGSSGKVSEVPLPNPIKGPDGLTALGGGRFLIVEGGGLRAGARGALLGVTVTGDTATVDTIASDLNIPTTAVVVGDTAYVVEGQLDHLFDQSAGAADPYRILAVTLPEAYR